MIHYILEKLDNLNCCFEHVGHKLPIKQIQIPNTLSPNTFIQTQKSYTEIANYPKILLSILEII
jgi:hypothetical protein